MERGRGGSPLVRKGETEFYPDGERIAFLAQAYDPNDPYTQTHFATCRKVRCCSQMMS